MPGNASQNQAAAWLQSGPNGINDLAVVSEILASFEGSPSIETIAGPSVLIRAVGSDDKGKLAGPYRGYWVRQSTLTSIHSNLGQFEGWWTDEELAKAKEWRYRAFTAICLNWNDFSEFAELELPAGENIRCLIGKVASQPVSSRLSAQAPNTPILRGGAEQIFFRGGDANPLWVRLRQKADIF